MAGVRTFAIIKPDAVAAGHTNAIIGRIEAAGFVIRARTMMTLVAQDTDALYEEHIGRSFYADLLAFMNSGASVLLVLEAPDAVKRWRSLMGATDSKNAEAGTIRADFGDKAGPMYRNAVHGSDSDNAAEREIGIFFPACGVCAEAETIAALRPPLSKVDEITDRTGAPRVLTLSAVAAEIQRGRRKFPGRRFLLAALVEEVGELAQAIAEGKPEDAREEALQVAAVAIRIAEEGDQTRYALDRMISVVVGLGMGVRFLLQRNKTDALFSFTAAANAARRVAGSGDPTFDDVTDAEAIP